MATGVDAIDGRDDSTQKTHALQGMAVTTTYIYVRTWDLIPY